MPANIKYPVVDGLKECGECHKWLPIEQYNKARTHYNSRCKDCLTKYAKEYRARPEVKEHNKKYHQDYIKDPQNRDRKNAYSKVWKKQSHVRAKINLTRRNWTLIEKQKAIEYKGGKCVLCGYNTCTAALDFHHKDPSIKDGYGTGAMKAHWTFEKNKIELDKCVLLCVRCHREVHAGVVVL